MGYFDAIERKISETGHGVVQKTKDTAEILRLNSMISDEQKRIQAFYTEIGKRYYSLHADSCEPELTEPVAGVRDAAAKIEAYSDQIKKLKGYTACPNCGNSVAPNTPFCSACGTAIITPPAAAPCCAKCGQPLAQGAAFCIYCGAKAEVAEPAAPAQPQPPVTPSDPPAAQPAAPVEPTVTQISPPDTQPEPPVAQENPFVYCTRCGKQLPAGTAFCTECGQRVNG